MLDELKEKVYKANLELFKRGLVIFTWGNVSGFDKSTGLVVIKPSGIEYSSMKPEDLVVTDLNGKVVEGELKPSSDLFTHLEIYKNFHDVGGVAHTHSVNAVAFAQAGKDIVPLGTTHADYFCDIVPCTRLITPKEISNEYELNTGKVIVEEFENRNINPNEVQAVLVHSHGPFTWGKDPLDAVDNSIVLETLADMAIKTLKINPNVLIMQKELLEKHYRRKHGPKAYYGQNK